MLYTCFTLDKGFKRIKARGLNHAHEKSRLAELIMKVTAKDMAVKKIGVRERNKTVWTENKSILIKNGVYTVLVCGQLIRDAEFLKKVKLDIAQFLLFQKNGKNFWAFQPKIAVSNKRRDL